MVTLAATRRTVKLYGHLAERFGDEFQLAVRSPGEALRLLEANFPGQVVEALKDGEYHVIVGDPDNPFDYYPAQMVDFQSSHKTIHIMPALTGSKEGGKGKGRSKGLILAIIGVVLIATAFIGAAGFLGGAAAGAGSISAGFAASTGVLGITWGTVALFGGALALAGISQLLTPTPKEDEPTEDQKAESFFFNGPVNLTQEGSAVPLIYGRILAGSVVVHGGITVEKLDPAAKSSTITQSTIETS